MVSKAIEARICELERLIDKRGGPAANYKAAVNLAHARKEWAQGPGTWSVAVHDLERASEFLLRGDEP